MSQGASPCFREGLRGNCARHTKLILGKKLPTYSGQTVVFHSKFCLMSIPRASCGVRCPFLGPLRGAVAYVPYSRFGLWS